MSAQAILLSGIGVFAVSVAAPEIAHLKQFHLGEKTISHYLRGKLGYITDIGFLVCFLTMQFLACELGLTVGGFAAALFGLGVLLAMLTARFAEFLPSLDFADRAHVTVTIVALLASVVLMVAESKGVAMNMLWISAVAVTCTGFATQATIATIEKIAVLMIALWLVAYTLITF